MITVVLLSNVGEPKIPINYSLPQVRFMQTSAQKQPSRGHTCMIYPRILLQLFCIPFYKCQHPQIFALLDNQPEGEEAYIFKKLGSVWLLDLIDINSIQFNSI